MKKTCNGCRALENIGYEQQCSLGYSMTVDVIGKLFGRDIHKAKPLEECPKPKTYDIYYALVDKKK